MLLLHQQDPRSALWMMSPSLRPVRAQNVGEQGGVDVAAR
jgi:hypothetical protein